jgi:hypothetical protein
VRAARAMVMVMKRAMARAVRAMATVMKRARARAARGMGMATRVVGDKDGSGKSDEQWQRQRQ